MGPYLLRLSAHPTDGSNSAIWSRTETFKWPHSDGDPCRNVGHGGDCRQLRENGGDLSVGGIGLYLCGTSNPPSPGVPGGLGDAPRLHLAAAAQRYLDICGASKP